MENETDSKKLISLQVRSISRCQRKIPEKNGIIANAIPTHPKRADPLRRKRNDLSPRGRANLPPKESQTTARDLTLLGVPNEGPDRRRLLRNLQLLQVEAVAGNTTNAITTQVISSNEDVVEARRMIEMRTTHRFAVVAANTRAATLVVAGQALVDPIVVPGHPLCRHLLHYLLRRWKSTENNARNMPVRVNLVNRHRLSHQWKGQVDLLEHGPLDHFQA